MRKVAVVAAGGTGGHLFPAQALAEALIARGWTIVLASDERVAGFAGDFPAERRIALSAATYKPGDPIGMARAGFAVMRGALQARAAYREIGPHVVVGFGGYPSAPALVAALWEKRPTVIHEQNAVMGRANRMLAPKVRAIATGFAGILNREPALAAKATHTGNPVRPAVIAAASTPYPELDTTGPLRLLVFGGSQGARVMSEIVPPAIALLNPDVRARLSIVQQARAEDLEAVRGTYAELDVAADCAPFFADLPQRIAVAHLVVSRSGASTVAELSAIGRPGVLVPLPHALDQDQLANAGMLEAAGGAICIVQRDFTPERLAAEIARLAGDPGRLAAMAAAAKSTGTLDAAERLADLVLKVAGN
jgi:UDP-N-acetylglucosamine--N-acetylmuramyl-(pentapeptide) pyrophosphoryl-undecaprenol N-acetylglucosamine transferase